MGAFTHHLRIVGAGLLANCIHSIPSMNPVVCIASKPAPTGYTRKKAQTINRPLLFNE
jgi:hypothetical protein